MRFSRRFYNDTHEEHKKLLMMIHHEPKGPTGGGAEQFDLPSDLIECIGGPLNGQMHTVNMGGTHLIVPVLDKPSTFLLSEADPNKSITYKEERYTLQKLAWMEDGWEHFAMVWVHESLTLEQALAIWSEWHEDQTGS